jgi:DNA-binding SARP family transcriptional activator
VEVLVLGPLRVRSGTDEVVLERAKERTVLSALAMRAGSVVAADELIEALWHGAPPRTAAKTLQNHVLRLRRVLGDAPISTQPAGYRLDVVPADVDAQRFESVVRNAAAAELPPETAAKALTGALTEWRGDAYQDLIGWSVGEAEARRLADIRLIAEELWAESELACNRHALAAGELRAMVEREPLRERRWELLMLALYRDGRQAEALHAFAHAQHLLDHELGAHPGPALAALERAILRQDAKLDPELPDYAYDAVAQRRRAVAALDVADARAHAHQLRRLGEAQRDAGDPMARETLLLAAAAARDADLAQEATKAALAATRKAGMGSVGEGVDTARVAALETALATSDDGAARARVLSALAAELTYTATIDERLRLADEALDIARGLGDERVLVDVLLRRLHALASPELIITRDRESVECLETADALDDPARTWAAANARSAIALQVGALADCDRALTMAQRATDEIGTPGMRYVTLTRLAARDLAIGRIAAAERAIDEAFAIGRATGQPGAIDLYSLQLVHVRHAQGRLGELRDVIVSLDLDRPHPLPKPLCAWALATLGEHARARHALRAAVIDAPNLHEDEFKLVALSYAAMAAAALHDKHAAQELTTLLARYPDHAGNTGGFVMPRTSTLLAGLEKTCEQA